MCVAETNRIVDELSRQAIRRGSGAAWISLDWLGESEFFQLICLGPELYNGVSGIALFLAAHSGLTGSPSSAELALAGVSHLRRNLKSRNAARVARSVGIGGAAGLGSIVYALSVMSEWLHDEDLLADAHAAAELFTDDLIKSDKQLDIIGGSAGANSRPASSSSPYSIRRGVEERNKVRRALDRSKSARTAGPPELGWSRLWPTPT